MLTTFTLLVVAGGALRLALGWSLHRRYQLDLSVPQVLAGVLVILAGLPDILKTFSFPLPLGFTLGLLFLDTILLCIAVCVIFVNSSKSLNLPCIFHFPAATLVTCMLGHISNSFIACTPIYVLGAFSIYLVWWTSCRPKTGVGIPSIRALSCIAR